MRRTTVYLPDDLKSAIERVARGEDQSEAAFIRQALQRAVDGSRGPRPRLPLFASGDRRLAERVDEELEGFGER